MTEAKAAPATEEQTSPAETNSKTNVYLKVCDGTLSLTVMTKPSMDGNDAKFAILQRSYQKKGSKDWENTQFLHVEDFLRAAELLRESYTRLRQSAPVVPTE